MDPLVEASDVEVSLLRPLTDTEETFIVGLCDQASALLRQVRRDIDDRVARFVVNPTDPNGCDPQSVAAMLAAVIKRSLVNPKGLWSTSETDGDYSYSETYPGARSGGDSGTAGDLTITASDLAKIDRAGFAYRAPIRGTQVCW